MLRMNELSEWAAHRPWFGQRLPERPPFHRQSVNTLRKVFGAMHPENCNTGRLRSASATLSFPIVPVRIALACL